MTAGDGGAALFHRGQSVLVVMDQGVGHSADGLRWIRVRGGGGARRRNDEMTRWLSGRIANAKPFIRGSHRHPAAGITCSQWRRLSTNPRKTGCLRRECGVGASERPIQQVCPPIRRSEMQRFAAGTYALSLPFADSQQ